MSTEQLTLNNLLILACKSGDVDSIPELLDNGANINGPNESGQTPLITAVQNKQDRIVEYLLKNGANAREYANVHENGSVYKYSAIDVATTAPVVEMLIKAGANVNSRFGGATPLHNAVDRNDQKIAEILLDAGAEIDAVISTDVIQGDNVKNKNDIYGSSYDNYTPLMLAVEIGYYNMCEFLIKRGADVNKKNRRGETSLDIAENRGKISLNNEKKKRYNDIAELLKNTDKIEQPKTYSNRDNKKGGKRKSKRSRTRRSRTRRSRTRRNNKR